MKKIVMLGIAFLVVGCGIGASGEVNEHGIEVNDFKSCVAAGNPVMESFPAQCAHEGIVYVDQAEEVIEIPDNCESWFDGCNNCRVGEAGMLACTRMFCAPEMMKKPKCTKFRDDSGSDVVPEIAENQLVGGDRDEHGCIASAGYIWSASKEECIRPWEVDDVDNEAPIFCGGITGINCGEGMECHLDGDYPDAGGICVSIGDLDSPISIPEVPVMCTMEYAPVCGVDGVTYGNACSAGDVEILHKGECK